MNRRVTAAAILLILGALALVVASLAVGTESLSIADAWREWSDGGPLSESPTLSVLVEQRLPRTLAALLSGAALALAGCAFQALLRNPLATPYTLGVASAGSFGAFAATVVGSKIGLTFTIGSFTEMQASAFLFAALDVMLIYLLASRRRGVAPEVLLLAGVTLGMLANAGIMLLRYYARAEELVFMDRWMMGAVNVLGYGEVKTLLIGGTPCVLILLAQAAKYDQLGFGAELAEGRGVHVRRLQAVTFFVGSLLTAIIVSEVGPIGFVGLIVPHAVRGVTGSRHRVLMPMSLVAGGAFLCACDIVARKLTAAEMPIGIITSIVGGPFFLYLLTRRRFTGWET